jgi:Uma2 family endonuclease
MTTRSKPTMPEAVFYPSEADVPNDDLHRNLVWDLIKVLERHFQHDPDVYVSGDMFVYWEEGVPTSTVAPDVYFVRGTPKRQRRNYLIWEEGVAPQFVMEVLSPSTQQKDRLQKPRIYQEIFKVREYFLFDQTGEYLDPILQGFRRRGNSFSRIRSVDDRIPSKVLDLHFENHEGTLRVFDPNTLQYLLFPDEFAERAEQERQRADRAEEELRRLRRLLEQTQSTDTEEE